MNDQLENNSPEHISIFLASIIFLQGIFAIVVGMIGIYYFVFSMGPKGVIRVFENLLQIPYVLIFFIYEMPTTILYVLAVVLYVFFPLFLARTKMEKRLAKWTVIISISALWISLAAFLALYATMAMQGAGR